MFSGFSSNRKLEENLPKKIQQTFKIYYLWSVLGAEYKIQRQIKTLPPSHVGKIKKNVQLTRGKEKWVQCSNRNLSIVERGKINL